MSTNDVFNQYVKRKAREGLVVQPRMGFSDIELMRTGLEAVKSLPFPTVGTITIDAMTRQGLHCEAKEMVRKREKLNGFPLASFDEPELASLFEGLSDDFPIQVRHGTPLPMHVFEAAMRAGLYIIEGGPVSYALPYGKTRLTDTFVAWQESLERWVAYGAKNNIDVHLESFSGCMMGQLCPPSILIALNILEGLWFESIGIRSLSLSLAQGTSSEQDTAALRALRTIADNFLQEASFHIVAYTWMGVFPESARGAERLIKESAKVARVGGAERLIVKTVRESIGIPTIEDNLQALEWCHNESKQHQFDSDFNATNQRLYNDLVTEATSIIDAVLSMHRDIGVAIQGAFQKGYLDIPFCIHPDNSNSARPLIDRDGKIGWAKVGNVPIDSEHKNIGELTLSSSGLLKALRFNREKFDLIGACCST